LCSPSFGGGGLGGRRSRVLDRVPQLRDRVGAEVEQRAQAELLRMRNGGADVVAGPRPFDLDDRRAEFRERHGGQDPAEVRHQQSVKRRGHDAGTPSTRSAN